LQTTWHKHKTQIANSLRYLVNQLEYVVLVSMSACLSVCLSVRLHNSTTAWPSFTKVFMHVACGRGSVLLWRRCEILCTSGFTNDVLFSYHMFFIPQDQWTESSTTLCLNVRRLQCLVEFVRMRRRGRTKSAIYDCLVIQKKSQNWPR